MARRVAGGTMLRQVGSKTRRQAAPGDFSPNKFLLFDEAEI
jgi:hypothetical protein